ncbi:MAG: NAD(P)H-hydrate dehydratase [Patescibacteria group bacterium]|nr:NAD(P)H-hydrate dehydratase [Patescibacteria group bacterium]
MHISVKTSAPDTVRPYLKDFFLPKDVSYKGQNGKVMVIGGSVLFHAASIWTAEIASKFADMVHYSSVEENNEIVRQLKTVFRSGIVVPQTEIPAYVAEDDAVLIGPGMVRGERGDVTGYREWSEVLSVKDESLRTRAMVYFLFNSFPEKRFVIDAGALQMMDAEWFRLLSTPAILTPHQQEFQRLFGIDVQNMSLEEKCRVVRETATSHSCVILLKAIVDIVSDGADVVTIEGGNAGLTKGGTGDVLAGVTTALYAKNEPVVSCILASYLEKKTADNLFETKGYWYNVADLIDKLPETLTQLALRS